MESNGKSVTADGAPVAQSTGEIVWGSPGTNAQHAYFQLLHQGTVLVPLDLVGFLHAQPGHERGNHNDQLFANLIAQAEALAFGTDDPALPPYRVMPGNRPTSLLVARQLTPHALGALIAAYEHKVMVLGTLWGIDSFDQWGVELGKQLARRIVGELRADESVRLEHDSSTAAWIRRYRESSS
jgi:glucose-6-phosphate isomerase